ncbi:unnamed protein product [Protopolystoma xenopodis]|uniref:Uncharacterized protein n=1 Tax=Protopolystoma xenopodis TaxID=117903 RepID=A0A3S5CUN5_9PLAT|nr:unnamed protein product [Protopolystoma xenopodis]
MHGSRWESDDSATGNTMLSEAEYYASLMPIESGLLGTWINLPLATGLRDQPNGGARDRPGCHGRTVELRTVFSPSSGGGRSSSAGPADANRHHMLSEIEKGTKEGSIGSGSGMVGPTFTRLILHWRAPHLPGRRTNSRANHWSTGRRQSQLKPKLRQRRRIWRRDVSNSDREADSIEVGSPMRLPPCVTFHAALKISERDAKIYANTGEPLIWSVDLIVL